MLPYLAAARIMRASAGTQPTVCTVCARLSRASRKAVPHAAQEPRPIRCPLHTPYAAPEAAEQAECGSAHCQGTRPSTLDHNSHKHQSTSPLIHTPCQQRVLVRVHLQPCGQTEAAPPLPPPRLPTSLCRLYAALESVEYTCESLANSTACVANAKCIWNGPYDQCIVSNAWVSHARPRFSLATHISPATHQA